MNETEQWFRPTGGANIATITAYIDRLFRCWDWSQGGLIALRGIGEKGTPKEGVFRENKLISPASPFYLSQIETHASRWGQNSIASFLLPGIVSSRSVIDGDVKEDKIEAFTALCVDIDSGNVEEKLDHCREWIGEPSFVVLSGGQTELAHDKVHAYWCLNAPTDAIAEVGRLRKLLAAKVGGDRSFGRPAQVIRVAGSIYGKGGVHKPVTIALDSGLSYDFHDLADGIEGMEWMEGCEPPELAQVSLPSMDQSGAMDFSGGAGKDLNRLEGALTTPVAAGGDGEETRWSRFNQVAGHYIHCAREGKMTLDEARELVHGWMVANMQPPWPEPRFAQEWTGLLNKDRLAKGEFGEPASIAKDFGLPEPAAHKTGIEKIESAADLLSWAVVNRSSESPAARIDLVDNMIVAGQRHLLVAEGGAGKTFLCMDLALKVASSCPDYPTNYWLGQMMTPESHDATAVMFTAEDNQAALDRRWARIDPDMKLRRRAGDRLLVVPMDNIGGSFPLVMNKPHGGGAVMATPEWANMIRVLYELRDQGRKIKLVVIDTLNATLHGEEASAEVIAQYMRALAPITAELGAALIITHHVRKARDDKKVADADAMLDAIRGSAAIKDNVRVAIGVWRAPDYKRRMRLMGLPEEDKRLYCAEIVKANEPMYKGAKYLLRQNSGLLEDVSLALGQLVDTIEVENMAWLRFIIERYAEEQGFWFTKHGTGSGMTIMRHLLPPHMRKMSRNEIVAILDKMLDMGILISCKVRGGGSTQAVFFDLAENYNKPREAIAKDDAVKSLDWTRFAYNPSTVEIEPVR